MRKAGEGEKMYWFTSRKSCEHEERDALHLW